MKPIYRPLPAVLAALTFAAVAAQAQEKPSVPPKQAAIDEIDCRTLLRLGGEERAFTILYLHGYVSGMKGQKLLPVQELAEATDRIVDQCIDRPGERLLPVFERVRGR